MEIGKAVEVVDWWLAGRRGLGVTCLYLSHLISRPVEEVDPNSYWRRLCRCLRRIILNPTNQKFFLLFSAYFLIVPTFGLPKFVTLTYALVLLSILCI